MGNEIRVFGHRVRVVDLKIWAVGIVLLLSNIIFFFLFWYK